MTSPCATVTPVVPTTIEPPSLTDAQRLELNTLTINLALFFKLLTAEQAGKIRAVSSHASYDEIMRVVDASPADQDGLIEGITRRHARATGD